MLLMLLVAFSVSFFVEDGILQNHRLWLLIKALFRFCSSSQYRKLQRQLEEDAKWPPTSQKDFAEEPKSGAYVNPVYDEVGEN
ncbi:putative cation-transporting ATPase 13A5 [Podarcis muralis]